jgi:hypothetical protein
MKNANFTTTISLDKTPQEAFDAINNEHFPYRQIQMLWGLQGMWQYLRGDMAWGQLRRQGLHP